MESQEQAYRTSSQNRALHKLFELIADELNEAGLDMKQVLPRQVDIPWSRETVKELIWRPIQDAQLRKRSTTELTRGEIDAVYETVNRFLSGMGLHVPFPSLTTVEEEKEFIHGISDTNMDGTPRKQ